MEDRDKRRPDTSGRLSVLDRTYNKRDQCHKNLEVAIQGLANMWHLYFLSHLVIHRSKSKSRRHLWPIRIQTAFPADGNADKTSVPYMWPHWEKHHKHTCLKVPWLWWLVWHWFEPQMWVLMPDETISINMHPASWIEGVTFVNWLVRQKPSLMWSTYIIEYQQ